MNEQEGLLVSWSIEFDVKECDYEYRWTELPSTDTSYKVPDEITRPDWKSRDIRKRYDHTAVSTGAQVGGGNQSSGPVMVIRLIDCLT